MLVSELVVVLTCWWCPAIRVCWCVGASRDVCMCCRLADRMQSFSQALGNMKSCISSEGAQDSAQAPSTA
eukprot:15484388-Alexandrium_andersonii.AAC.1